MKFRFVGDLDCPDWALAEIGTLSKISSIKAKQLSTFIINSIQNKEEIPNDKIVRLANDTKLDINDIKASISLLYFILVSASTHCVNSETLSSELQQLGLPKEHSTSICKNYEDNYGILSTSLKYESLKINCLKKLSWRVDYIFSSNYLDNVNEPIVNLKLEVINTEKQFNDVETITLNKKKFKLLISEMKEAKKFMDINS